MGRTSVLARGNNLRGSVLPIGTLSLVGPTPFGSGVLNASLTSGAPISGSSFVLAATPTWGAEFGYATGGGGSFGNVATLALLNNGTTKQCVAISSGSSPGGAGVTAGTVTLTPTGINVTTYQDAFNTSGPKTTSVSFIPAEYVTTGGTTYLSAADAPPAVGGSCNRYSIAVTGLPNVTVDIAESTHPAAPLQIVLKILAEVFPFSNFAPYSFEGAGVNIVQNIVSAAGGMSSILLEAGFSGGNAWNSNTGLILGHPKGAVHLAARYMSLIKWVYQQYCLTTGAHYPAGASGNLPLTVWSGSGSTAGVMLCCQYYGLGLRSSDVYVTKFIFDAYGAGVLTYREVSGLAADAAFNPVVAAGSSAAGLQVVAEGLLDDQTASYPPTAGGNWNPTTLQPLGGLGEGQGPSYQSLLTSGWGPTGAYAGSVGALTVHTGAGFTITSSTNPSTFTADGTATGWPGVSVTSRDVNGIVTIPLTGGGTVLCSYNSIATGSPNTFKGCTWSKTGTVASGAALQCGGQAFGYAAAGPNLSNQADGPFALPATALAPNSLTRRLRFIAGALDTSNLPILTQTWLPGTPLSSTKYIWQVIQGASHDVSSTLAGASAIEAHLFDQPSVLQNISQTVGATTTSMALPGWKVNGTNPHSIQNNNAKILWAAIWTASGTTLPTPPITTQSPSSGINSWQRVPAGLSSTSPAFVLPVQGGTSGFVTFWSKVATGLETSADLVFTQAGGANIWSALCGEVGIALDNPALASTISVQNATTQTSTGNACYGVDICGAAVGTTTLLTCPNLAPTSTTRSVALGFVAATVAGDITTPVTPTNGYSSVLMNGSASFALTPAGVVPGGTTGALGCAQKALLNASSTTNFNISSSASIPLSVAYIVFKGSTNS